MFGVWNSLLYNIMTIHINTIPGQKSASWKQQDNAGGEAAKTVIKRSNSTQNQKKVVVQTDGTDSFPWYVYQFINITYNC